MPEKTQITFESIIDALVDTERPFPARFLRRFSDLSENDARNLGKNWNYIPATRKVTWLEDLEDLTESDTTTSFVEVGKLAINDTEASVREMGIRLLWECEERSLIKPLLRLLNDDPVAAVQAAAANALGHFIFLGEIDELSPEQQLKIEQALMAKFTHESPMILRQRAIESLGYSGNPEVDPLIRQAYADSNPAMKASALFAMGHSANEVWKDTVLANLSNPLDQVRLEAIRAAGELELAEARDPLLQMLEQDDINTDELIAGAWSLSQIGGAGIQERLEKLADNPDLDDETLELLDDALENLVFTSNLPDFSLMGLDDAVDDEDFDD